VSEEEEPEPDNDEGKPEVADVEMPEVTEIVGSGVEELPVLDTVKDDLSSVDDLSSLDDLSSVDDLSSLEDVRLSDSDSDRVVMGPGPRDILCARTLLAIMMAKMKKAWGMEKRILVNGGICEYT